MHVEWQSNDKEHPVDCAKRQLERKHKRAWRWIPRRLVAGPRHDKRAKKGGNHHHRKPEHLARSHYVSLPVLRLKLAHLDYHTIRSDVRKAVTEAHNH